MKLKELRKSRNISQLKLAMELNMNQNTISRYETGEREAGYAELTAIADYFNVDMDYLLGRSDSLGSFSNVFPLPSIRQVPLIGTIACGQPILAVEDAEEHAPMPGFVHADFALRCKGDSMINARIFDGDLVYIRRQPQVENGQIAAVRIGEEATLKRVYQQPGRVVLRACNPLYADMEYEGAELNDIEVLGLAVAFTSTIK